MSDNHKKAAERVIKLVKTAKKTGQKKEDISSVALERIAEEFQLPVHEVHAMLQTA